MRITLNGTPIDLEADPSTPLLTALRNEAGVWSPRFGCGSEQCGSCKVLVDGIPEYACTLPVGEVEDNEVTTVEGLGTDDQLNRLQVAFLKLNAGQCGFCLSGILVSAHALLSNNPNPSRTDVQVALQDHLCRCGAHNRIINAVLEASSA